MKWLKSDWARLDDAETKTLNALFHNHSKHCTMYQSEFLSDIHFRKKSLFKRLILNAVHINNAHAASNISNIGVVFLIEL